MNSYKTNGYLNSDIVIRIFDDFASKIEKETFVILDNAPTHKSKKFSKNLEKWKSMGLNLLYLPPYSPQLNKIEILWRFMKYKWINIQAYNSFKDLDNHLEEILSNYGNLYTINFS